MKIKLNRQNKGFTIIEVMIVLAIAGLILAIVLLAVPALQRSQRNNARSSDATHWAGVVGDYVSNHGGQMPTVAPTSTDSFSQLKTLSLVNAVAGTLNTTTFGTATTTNAVVDTGVKCDPSLAANQVTVQVGSFAIIWQYEPTSATSLSCIPG